MAYFDHIIEIVCTGEKTTFEIINEDNRKEENVFCRQLIMYFAKKRKAGTLRFIGDKFSKDHATVSHAIKAIENYINTDRDKRNVIEAYSKKIDDIDRLNALQTQMSEIVGDLKKEISKLEKNISQVEQRLINVRLSIDNIMNQINT